MSLACAEGEQWSADISVLKLLAYGIGFGIQHVLSGPDHLSAMATLSCNTLRCEAFLLGARWGVGHSLGLLLCTAVLLEAGGDFMCNVAHYAETTVGFVMIGLGLYRMWKAWRVSHELAGREAAVKQIGIAEAEEEVEFAKAACVLPERVEEEKKFAEVVGVRTEEEFKFADGVRVRTQNVSHRTICPSHGGRLGLYALLVGLIHGVAGPGGILGVLPALVLNSWGPSSAYLVSFCGSSIITMGVFALFYGRLTSACGSEALVMFRVNMFSGFLSLFAGILWLCLIFTTGEAL